MVVAEKPNPEFQETQDVGSIVSLGSGRDKICGLITNVTEEYVTIYLESEDNPIIKLPTALAAEFAQDLLEKIIALNPQQQA